MSGLRVSRLAGKHLLLGLHSRRRTHSSLFDSLAWWPKCSALRAISIDSSLAELTDDQVRQTQPSPSGHSLPESRMADQKSTSKLLGWEISTRPTPSHIKRGRLSEGYRHGRSGISRVTVLTREVPDNPRTSAGWCKSLPSFCQFVSTYSRLVRHTLRQ
jgi:hypothetical protein